VHAAPQRQRRACYRGNHRQQCCSSRHIPRRNDSAFPKRNQSRPQPLGRGFRYDEENAHAEHWRENETAHGCGDSEPRVEGLVGKPGARGAHGAAGGARGAQIICLPELYRTIYFPQYEKFDARRFLETILGESTNAFSRLAKELGVVIIVPIFEKARGGKRGPAVL
jgi:hypothetical protein